MRRCIAIAIVTLWLSGCSSDDPPSGADAGDVADCTDLDNDPRNCGICGRTCVIPNAVAGCSEGECVIDSCDQGFVDEDSDPRNGCELQSNCVEGGECTTECGSTGVASCEGGEVASCELPAEQCNAIDDNCDGSCDEGALAGCRTPIHRAFGNGHLYTTDLAAASTSPFSLEAQNYFYVYTEQAPGTQPVFLCTKADGKGLVTSSTSCEGVGAVSTTLGYWSPTPTCGSIELHRLFNPGSNDHFYTTSAPERDNAVTSFGYVSEGIAGYVWPAP